MKLVINRDRYSILKNREEIILPRKQFEIIWLLCSVPGKVFSRQTLFEKIWGETSTSDPRTVDVHLASLRKRLGAEYFRTIKGIGYKVTVDKVDLIHSSDSFTNS